MNEIVMLSVQVFLGAILAAIGALFIELRDHRDRLVRIETQLSLGRWVAKEGENAPRA